MARKNQKRAEKNTGIELSWTTKLIIICVLTAISIIIGAATGYYIGGIIFPIGLIIIFAVFSKKKK